MLFALAGSAVVGRSQAIHLEAENAGTRGPNLKAVRPDTSSNALRPSYSGTGYLSGFNSEEDMAVLRFKVKKAGIYELSVSYRAESKKGIEITVDGFGLNAILLPSAGETFTTQSLGKVELVAGQNEIVVHRGWGYFDLDAIDLTPASPALPPIQPSAMPSDPGIQPAARALLASLDASYGKTTLVGVYDDASAAFLLNTTGVRPVIMGGDLMRYSPQFQAHGSSTENEVERLIADQQAGMTITLSWHWASPSGVLDTTEKPWYRAFYADATRFNVQTAVTDKNSPEYVATISDIHQIALQLRKLQDAGVPVLWRPLHEAQDQAFWWGVKGPGPFKALWRLLYEQLTQVEGIHNLLWVFTSGGDPAWYPGDAFVDIIGIDAYPKDLHDPQNGLWNDLQKLSYGRKPLAITEFGGTPDIPRMQNFGEWWSYAVSWSGDLGPKKNEVADLKRIVTSPDVGTLGPVPGAVIAVPLQPVATPIGPAVPPAPTPQPALESPLPANPGTPH